MKPNYLFRALLCVFGVLASGLIAAPGRAVMTIDHSTTGSTTIAVGETIAIQVRATWDGAPGLFGYFSSTASGDAAILVGESAVSGVNFYRGSLFAFTDPDSGDATSLARFGQNQLRQAVDPLNVVRSVQYGSLTPINPLGAASSVLVTTITFRAVGPGVTTIGSFNALGDTGAQGNTTGVGTSVTVTVPEPHQIMLGLTALGSVLGVVAVRRRI